MGFRKAISFVFRHFEQGHFLDILSKVETLPHIKGHLTNLSNKFGKEGSFRMLYLSTNVLLLVELKSSSRCFTFQGEKNLKRRVGRRYTATLRLPLT